MRKADVAGNPRLLAQWEAKQARRRARRLGQGPIPRGKEGASVKQVFEKVLEGMKKNVEEDLRAHYTRLAKQAMEWEGMTVYEQGKASDQIYHKNNRSWKFSNPDYKFQQYLINYDYKPGVVGQIIKIVNVQKNIDKWVADGLRDMFESFIAKQTEKVNGIIKGRKVQVKSWISRSLEGTFDFILGDGAKFRMQTQIVWKTSPKGKRFWQFPTTFHNAIKANGTAIRNPSEANLKKEL
jgi:hypothetical protein